jgi:hypothetical protein
MTAMTCMAFFAGGVAGESAKLAKTLCQVLNTRGIKILAAGQK